MERTRNRRTRTDMKRLQITEHGRRAVDSREFDAGLRELVAHARDPNDAYEAVMVYTAVLLCSEENDAVALMDSVLRAAVPDDAAALGSFIDEHKAELSEMITRAAYRASADWLALLIMPARSDETPLPPWAQAHIRRRTDEHE